MQTIVEGNDATNLYLNCIANISKSLSILQVSYLLNEAFKAILGLIQWWIKHANMIAVSVTRTTPWSRRCPPLLLTSRWLIISSFSSSPHIALLLALLMFLHGTSAIPGLPRISSISKLYSYSSARQYLCGVVRARSFKRNCWSQGRFRFFPKALHSRVNR